MNEQRTDIAIPSLGDASQPLLDAAGVFAGRQAEPGHQVPAAVEGLAVASRRHECRRSLRADPKQRLLCLGFCPKVPHNRRAGTAALRVSGHADGEQENIATTVEVLAEYGPRFHGLDRGVRSSTLTNG